MTITPDAATEMGRKVLRRGEHGRTDLEEFLQSRAADLRDVVKGESVAQSYVRNFVGTGPLQPPLDPLGSAVFKVMQSDMHPGDVAKFTPDPSMYAPTFANPGMEFERLVAELVKQDPRLTRAKPWTKRG